MKTNHVIYFISGDKTPVKTIVFNIYKRSVSRDLVKNMIREVFNQDEGKAINKGILY